MNDKVVGLDGKAHQQEGLSTDTLLDNLKEQHFDHIVCIGIKDGRQIVASNAPNEAGVIAALEIGRHAIVQIIMNRGQS